MQGKAGQVAGERFRLSGDPGIEVALRRSARARRLSLRVSALDGRVTLTVPVRASVSEARAFAESRRDWIADARTRAPEGVRVSLGTRLPLDGGCAELVAGRGPRLEAGRLLVPPDAPERHLPFTVYSVL